MAAGRAARQTNETPAQREARLKKDRDRKSAAQSEETPAQRQARQQADRERKAAAQAGETPAHRQARQQADRSQRAQSRATETEAQAQARQQAEKTQKAQNRSQNKWYREAFKYDQSIDYAAEKAVFIGPMSADCKHCKALKFKKIRWCYVESGGEAPGFCCGAGKVKLDPPKPPPEPLNTLLEGKSPEAKHFIKNIRPYNSAFNMTSFCANQIKELGWMPTFKVQGQVYHLIGSLEPMPNEPAKFLQLYFVGGSHDQAQQRSELSSATRLELILQLQELLHKCHPYVKDFKSLLERPQPENMKLVIDDTKRPTGIHPGRLNLPTCQEVGVIIPGGDLANKRSIILETKDAHLKRITETHRSYDTLQYPLLLPWGDNGYHIAIPQVIPGTEPPQEHPTQTVSSMDFYAYQLQVRDPVSHLHKAGDLFSQYITDMFVKIDSERLLWIKLHQKELRVDDYAHLKDSINNDGALQGQQGRLVILPSSHTGSPRYMHEKTQDGMKYVQTFGRPTLFVTFTCNPKWKDIQENIIPGQSDQHRHDIVARVFRQKLIRLMDLFKKGRIYGDVQAYMYSVEWQKRGLPHAHILLWLKDKVHASDIDKLISAELPDPKKDKKLYDIVSKHMVHGPCGSTVGIWDSACLKNKECDKKYPRRFMYETQIGEDGYPAYRRRSPEDGGHTASKIIKGRTIEIDNKWVVPTAPSCARHLMHI